LIKNATKPIKIPARAQQEAGEALFDAVLLKPISPSTLNDTLMRALKERGSLPLPTALSEQQIAGELRRHAGQRVLLAEDNPINQEVACELLTSMGLVVDVAEDGEQAVELATSRPYALVLMDVQMPVADGLVATRTIRQRLGRELPILAMTANALGEDRVACLEAGMNDHIGKPVDPALRYSTLLRWMPQPGYIGNSGGAAQAAANESAATPLKAALAWISGLDMALALRSIGASTAALEKVMRTFVRTYHDGAPGLLQSGAPGQVSPAELCHSLRVACGAIGATTWPATFGIWNLAWRIPRAARRRRPWGGRYTKIFFCSRQRLQRGWSSAGTGSPPTGSVRPGSFWQGRRPTPFRGRPPSRRPRATGREPAAKSLPIDLEQVSIGSPQATLEPGQGGRRRQLPACGDSHAPQQCAVGVVRRQPCMRVVVVRHDVQGRLDPPGRRIHRHLAMQHRMALLLVAAQHFRGGLD
jgi:CheY-like chemotaxis protein